MMRFNVRYIEDTTIRWRFYKKLHRDGNLPAEYNFQDGKLCYVVYYQHNKLHRTNGPAFIDYEHKIKWYYYQDRQYDSLEQIKMVEACM